VPWIYRTLDRLGFDEITQLALDPMGVGTTGAPGTGPGNIELRARYGVKKASPFLFAYDQE
jgi:hypothetical protein